MYDLERTICDLFRSRSTIEIQDFTAVLKAYAARRDKDLNRLTAYAEAFHLENVIRQTLQLLPLNRGIPSAVTPARIY